MVIVLIIENLILESVDADNTDLLIISCNYSIRLEDVTVELEEEAYEEMRNNK